MRRRIHAYEEEDGKGAPTIGALSLSRARGRARALSQTHRAVRRGSKVGAERGFPQTSLYTGNRMCLFIYMRVYLLVHICVYIRVQNYEQHAGIFWSCVIG